MSDQTTADPTRSRRSARTIILSASFPTSVWVAECPEDAAGEGDQPGQGPQADHPVDQDGGDGHGLPALSRATATAFRMSPPTEPGRIELK